MASEKRAQKFHTDDASLPRFGYCFWLVVRIPLVKFASTNQKGSLKSPTRKRCGIKIKGLTSLDYWQPIIWTENESFYHYQIRYHKFACVLSATNRANQSASGTMRIRIRSLSSRSFHWSYCSQSLLAFLNVSQKERRLLSGHRYEIVWKQPYQTEN